MSFTNLAQLQYYKKLKLIGFKYIKPIDINKKNQFYSKDSKNFEEIKIKIDKCQLCDFYKNRKNSFIGYGNIKSDILFLGFQPSIQENVFQNRVEGKAIKLLRTIIKSTLDISFENIYYTTILKCRLKNNLNKSNNLSKEIDECLIHLKEQIKFISPKIIITLGKESFEAFTAYKFNYQDLKGKIIEFDNYKLIPIESLYSILKNPTLKKEIFINFQLIQKTKEEIL